MDRNLVGQTIQGRYYIVKQLSRGGVGVTFVAQDRQCFDSECVVKQLKPQTTNPQALEVARRLFNREAEIMNRLGYDDRIPRLLAYFEDNKDFFLVQELIIGHDLSQEIIPGLAWSEAKCLTLLQDVLQVLLIVQQHNVVHRDLKPSNLMRRDRDGKIILIDFGSVKQVGTQIIDTAGKARQTVAVGTRSYMPVEQIRGRPGFYSDIYALGVIVVQALTGTPPKKLTFDRNGELVWRNKLDPAVHYQPRFLDLVDKMVRHRYQERYVAAGAVLSDLTQLDAEQNNNKKTIIISTGSSTPKSDPHNSSSETTTSVDIHASITADPHPMVERSFQPSNLSTSPQADQNFPKSRSTFIPAVIGVIALVMVGLAGWILTKPKIKPEIMLTFENSEQDFSIDYPKAWSKKNRDDMFSRGAVFLSPLENDADEFQEKVSILVEDLPANMSLTKYTQESVAQIEQLSDPNVSPPQTVDLGSETGQKVVYKGTENSSSVQRMQIWSVVGDRAYVITYTALPESYESYLPTVEKMIASFTRLN